MGRLVGEDNKGSAGSSRHLTLKEAIHVNDERTCKVDYAGGLNGNDGELPLFFPTTSRSSPNLSSKADDLNAGPENRKPVEVGWPLCSQEIGSWASSFRFEFDSQNGEKLQAMLERDEQISAGETNSGRKLTDRWSLTEGTPEGGSFRFIRNDGTEEFLSGHLKPPRQLGSFRFTTVFNANEKQEYDVTQSGDSLSVAQVGAARIKVAVNHHVPTSPRSEVLRRLSDLKAHPSSPRFTPEDVASYQKEKAKIAAVRDDIHQRLKKTQPLLKNEYSRKVSSSPVSQYHCKPQVSVLSELEIMEIKERRQQSSSSSELRGSPRRFSQSFSQTHPTSPTSRFRDAKTKLDGGCSTQERIVSTCKLVCKQSQVVVSNINSPSPDHVLSMPVAIPFKWEEEPGKPKTIAAAVDRALARRLSRDGIETSEGMEFQLGLPKGDVKSSTGVVESGNSGKGIGPEASGRSSPDYSNVDRTGRSGSHRYYGREYLRGLSREASLRRSSRRHSTHEKEALIDLDGSAAAKFLVEAFESPSRSPSLHGSSPTFVVPFKWEDAPGKAKVKTITPRPNVLQLPPRLAVPSLSSAESFSRDSRASAPFAGCFLPCLTASTPVHRKQSDRALVQFTSSKSLPPRFPSPPESRRRLGLVCSSTPEEGCQVRVSKSLNDKTSSHNSSEKSLIEPLSTTRSPARESRSLSVSELKSKSNMPSSPTSILCGPDEGNSQTSGSSIMFSSGDLEDFTTQTNHSRKSTSKSSSSTSCEYAEEDFAEFPKATRTTSTSISTEDIGLLDKQGAPTSSGYLNSKGEPLTLETLPTLQSVAKQEVNSSPEASPKRPSRLPYTMPSTAEQFLASCSTSGRRQLLQDLSPRLLQQFSGRRLSGCHSGANTPSRHFTSLPRASYEKAESPSSTYAASLELFSPAANLTEQRLRMPATPKALVLKSPLPRPRRRVQLMVSTSTFISYTIEWLRDELFS